MMYSDFSDQRRCSRRLRSPTFGYIIGDCSQNHGSSCRFGCQSGYTLVGKGRINCSNGRWTSREPKCRKSRSKKSEERKCRRVDSPRNAIKEGSCDGNAPPNSTCMIHCYDGKSFHGSTTLMCLPSGKWWGSAPRCKRQIGETKLVQSSIQDE